jgi:hypothetical protein
LTRNIACEYRYRFVNVAPPQQVVVAAEGVLEVDALPTQEAQEIPGEAASDGIRRESLLNASGNGCG